VGGYFTEDLLADASNTELLPHRKKTRSDRSKPTSNTSSRYIARKSPAGFSGLKRLLPASIHTVTDRGFELKVFLKVFLFVLACSIDVLL
jgi:hypothetical protein